MSTMMSQTIKIIFLDSLIEKQEADFTAGARMPDLILSFPSYFKT